MSSQMVLSSFSTYADRATCMRAVDGAFRGWGGGRGYPTGGAGGSKIEWRVHVVRGEGLDGRFQSGCRNC